jgi:hypothetical protein
MGYFKLLTLLSPKPLKNLGFLTISTVLTVLTITKLLLYLTKIQGLNYS